MYMTASVCLFVCVIQCHTGHTVISIAKNVSRRISSHTVKYIGSRRNRSQKRVEIGAKNLRRFA